ncbi:MAG: hypothetical protein M1480_13760 [Bacteroidetes bacterium]|nr:hypothetical protein [Bacteroidota bacterium]
MSKKRVGASYFIMLYGPTPDGVKWRPYKSEEGYLLSFSTRMIAKIFVKELSNFDTQRITDYHICRFI